jgi:caffeoyl-CoA O-methyltransferase
MRCLEEIDAKDRTDGTPRMQRLRQIPRETGQFIALLAASAPHGTWIEIGTSAGYSTLWLALACRQAGMKIITFEVLPEKAALAEQSFQIAQVQDVVELVVGDAREHIGRHSDISFCFLDAEKDVYGDCYDAVIPNMRGGGILAADNAISHEKDLKPMLNMALNDKRVDAMIVPIGKGLLLCRNL